MWIDAFAGRIVDNAVEGAFGRGWLVVDSSGLKQEFVNVRSEPELKPRGRKCAGKPCRHKDVSTCRQRARENEARWRKRQSRMLWSAAGRRHEEAARWAKEQEKACNPDGANRSKKINLGHPAETLHHLASTTHLNVSPAVGALRACGGSF